MKISVIIPYYNNSKEIKRSLLSVFAQSYKDFEIILINDASPDWEEALPIINSFNDDRLKVISHSTNKNGSAARNTGIKAAIGDFIAFLDADDEWKENHLLNLLNLMNLENPDVIYTSSYVLSGFNRSYSLPKNHINKSNNLGEYLFCDGGFMVTPGIMIKSPLAKKTLFNQNLRRHQDYDFLLKLEKSGARFEWSKEDTVIVHWENNNTDQKGGTWDFSEDWFQEYKTYLSSKAKTCFVLKFIVFRLLEKRNIKTGILKFLKYCKPWHISPKKYYFFLSILIFGKVIVPKK
ncbi:glycosyltransferase family 2 protein [Algoriphagus hitonicola]|uniref:Amylovoran biosynthesis glycosyltransferase AmsB n=1 Tax=Algoriphagus hitonicola TaxID=435880 RepID=A0A1I2XV77_9BACT|nr:glycosyltransferase family 2 protein [Algoriphagus hitonicola]SFH16021.1 amylovoran biosynthesis glycosyltransferase AmsB [Algoriphagus hitonicola]